MDSQRLTFTERGIGRINDSDTQEFKDGYRYGERCNLNAEVIPPAMYLTNKQRQDWLNGFSCALSDRLG